MKKIKKIFALCLLLCVVVAISACSHEHEAGSDLQNDADNHWYICTDDGCEEKLNSEAHTFDNGTVTTAATETVEGIMTYKCAVCGYEKNKAIAKLDHVHTWETEWSMDSTHHWHESTCGHEAKDMSEHIFDDGFIEKPATETEEGLIVYTCYDCGVCYEEELSTLTHIHVFADEYTFDEASHWYETTCGHTNIKGKGNHNLSDGTITKEPTEDEEGLKCYYCDTCDYVKEEVLAKIPHSHVFNDETLTCKCGLVHTTCEICGDCSTAECPNCRIKCAFIDKDDSIIYFAPSITLSPPEGPDGKKPGEDGAYIYDTSITASHTVLEGGAHAVLVSLPNGTAANSGVSFSNNRDTHKYGNAGYNCGLPIVGGHTKYIRLYFTNHGDSDLTFKYSGINYYYDYGKVELTLKAGESTVVVMKTSLGGNSVGINHQIVFTEDVAAGASLSVWGAYVADERLSGISVSVPASNLNFSLGETFSAEGLILKANGENYDNVFITGNYKTDLDGYVFTADDVAAGKKTVTVSFAGFTATYDVAVYAHIHNIEYVESKEVVPCANGAEGSDGLEAYYVCRVDGCGMYFTDATGNKVATAPDIISCHTEKLALPGDVISCTECDKNLGVKSMENWMIFNLPAKIHSFKGDFKDSNVKVEYGDVNGVAGTYITFTKGTVGNSDNIEGFKFQMENNLDIDYDVPYQHKIPNVGTNMADGSTRSLVVYFVNYGSEDITVTFVSDGNSKVSMTVTIPAGDAVIADTTMFKSAGYNYFDLYLNNTEALGSDVKIGMYGYVEILDGETHAPTVKQSATKTTFKVGDTFSAEGLILNVFLPNTYGRDMFVWTGYITNLDGHTFTDSDVGTKTVTVTFAGKTCTYEITVTAE